MTPSCLVALVLGGKEIAIVVLAVVAAVALVRLFFRVDDRIEARRKQAADLAAVLKEEGYDQCADVAAAYSIGDYTGFAGDIRRLVVQLLNSETRLALLRRPFYKQLSRALLDAEDYPKVLKLVQERQAAVKAEAGRALAAQKTQPAVETPAAAVEA